MGASGVLEGLEECDDGDIEDGDGCSAGCKVRCPGPALKMKEPLAGRAWAYVLADSR
jgi:cysteine-rich repeat protein